MLRAALLSGLGRWAVILPVAVVVGIRIHIEERLMLESFPADYPRYRRRVPQLVPGLQGVRRHQSRRA